MDLRERIHTTPMTARQWGIALICIVLTAIEGYEFAVMLFVLPTLAAEWKLPLITSGYLLSASIFGMTAGAFLVAPWADRIGRRPHIMMCLTGAAACMALTGWA